LFFPIRYLCRVPYVFGLVFLCDNGFSFLSINAKVLFPTVLNSTWMLDQSALDAVFKQIEDVNIKTIMSLMSGDGLNYFVAEATK